MKKLFLITTCILALALNCNKSNAQTAFQKGDLGLNFGLGLGDNDGYYYGNYHSGNIFVPTFNFALDYGILGNIINSHGSISAGGYFGIGRGSNDEGGYKDIDNRWRLGTRGMLHYTWVNNLDTYAGLCVGYGYEKLKRKDKNSGNQWDSIDDSRFDIFPIAGVRLMFGSFGIYSELTWQDFAYFQIGITFIL